MATAIRSHDGEYFQVGTYYTGEQARSILITDAMGVYIPRNFATYFGDKRSEHVANVSDEDWAIQKSGGKSRPNS